MIQQTSLMAYREIRKDLGYRQRLVYQALKDMKGATNLQISKFLMIPINSITPRVKELRDNGYVYEKGIAIQESGRKAIIWGAI